MYGHSGFGIPDTIFLLRGHQECRLLTYYSISGFECKLKYSERLYGAFVNSFCALPLAAFVVLLRQNFGQENGSKNFVDNDGLWSFVGVTISGHGKRRRIEGVASPSTYCDALV
ncbi:hypothetical protein BGY98DRAFT_1136543 [Russula aff. rugulosa BPL654]|nr:hypothetical protein BGY98DRAFT_1136543 [Russula aff. rugulosa BPL654]